MDPVEETVEFKALVMRPGGETERQPVLAVEYLPIRQLPAADVTVAVAFAGLSFRDSLAISGRGRWIASYPHVPGGEFAGTVLDSNDERFAPGMAVLGYGHGIGERYWGGLAERIRVIGDWLMPVPQGLSTRDAMALGSAAISAQMAVSSLLKQGVTPDDGPVLVTGAAGEVGAYAVSLLARHGFRVVAGVRDPEMLDFVMALGASELLDINQLLARAGTLLGKEHWAGIVDTAGGAVLAAAMGELMRGGIAVVTPPTEGHDLPISLAPFVIRGGHLLGVDAWGARSRDRQQCWEALMASLAGDLPQHLCSEIELGQVAEYSAQILQGEQAGRVIVDLTR